MKWQRVADAFGDYDYLSGQYRISWCYWNGSSGRREYSVFFRGTSNYISTDAPSLAAAKLIAERHAQANINPQPQEVNP